MSDASPRIAPARILLAMASAALPAASLSALAGVGRDPSDLPVPFFAEPGLLAAHCVCALPLCWVTASAIRGLRAGSRPWGWACAGLAFIGAAWVIDPALASRMESLGAGFLARGLTRSALATLLVLPWMAAVVGPERGDSGSPHRILAAFAAMLIAVLPPMALAHRTIGSRASEFLAHRETGRLVRAWKALAVLRELGAGAVTASESVATSRLALAHDLRRVARSARDVPDASWSAVDRFRLAFDLIGLDQLERSEAVLRPLVAADDPDALLLLAAIERDRSRWAESVWACDRVIEGQFPMILRGGAALDRCTTAYDGLIDARFGAGRPTEAGRLIREALGRLPARKRHFTLRLGRYELEAGRPSVALGLFREADRLDPSLSAETRPLIRSVRVKTPACLLAR